MHSISRNLRYKAAIYAVLCSISIVFASVILCHEYSVHVYLQSRDDGNIFNSTWTCVASNTSKSYQSITLANIWCLIRRTATSRFVHHIIKTVLEYLDYGTIRRFYYTYIFSVVMTTLILGLTLLDALRSIIAESTTTLLAYWVLTLFYSVILLVYSFLTWRPVVILIFSAISCKAFKHSPDLSLILKSRPWLLAFVSLATFKFLKVFIHTASFYLLTNPAQQPVNPTLSPNDVTVIVPSIGEFDDEFIECIETIITNRPREIIVSTVGQDKFNRASVIAQELNSRHPDAKIRVLSNLTPNKRSQFMSGLLEAKTEITAYADDHVFWPPTFLRSSLAPFEDQHVGLVGTVKKVRRDRSGGFWKSFINYIACLYLERHNFECTASYNLDGGVFVISGRTALTRTEIMHDVDFRKEFLGETWWWGEVGPLKVDDDNCVTRWMVKHGWKTVFHNSPDAVVETSLGTTGGLEKFRGQLIRWVRTTWRSNATSLFAECDCWSVHPWTTYAMFISSFFNIALIYEPLLILTLYRSGYQDHIYSLLLALLISKLIKPIEHLRKEPRDIFIMLPMGLLFGYVHSIFKIWAFFTAGNIEWTGRKGLS